jgi:hypothetical protein
VQRILHEFPRLFFHKYQHIYIWLVYPYTTILWHFSNLAKLALGAARGQMYEGIAKVTLTPFSSPRSSSFFVLHSHSFFHCRR